MKLVIERGELLRALGHVTSVVERRTTIPILSNVLLKASGRACNSRPPTSSARFRTEAPADVSQPGAVTVPAHMLHDIVRKLPDGAEVEIKRDVEKERLTLAPAIPASRCRRCRRRTFPISPPASSATSSRSPPSDLKRLIDKTRFAISTEETRYYLNGIYLHAARAARSRHCARWRPTATDWPRRSCPAQGRRGMPGIILPRKTVHELHRLIEESGRPYRSGCRRPRLASRSAPSR